MLIENIKALPAAAKATVVATLLATSMQASAGDYATHLASPAEQIEIGVRDYVRQCLAVSGNHITDTEVTDCIYAASEVAYTIAAEMAENILEGSDD